MGDNHMDYYNLPARTISNAHISLDFLTQAGPRIVRLSVAGSKENLLAELPEAALPTPLGDFHILGGHRLWHAPEDMPRTYIPDDAGLTVEDLPGGVRLCQPTEAPTGIRKTMEIRLNPDRPALTIVHTLQNDGLWPVDLAAWGITQLQLGGLIVLPQFTGPADKHNLLSNRNIVLWPYTHLEDPRLQLFDDYILLYARGQAKMPACKAGCFNPRGWVGYLIGNLFFVKRAAVIPNAVYPDRGCNIESYVCDNFIEMETLGPMTHLEPGQTTTHVEYWEFYTGVYTPQSIEGVREVVKTAQLS
jgi:hypothetical protein